METTTTDLPFEKADELMKNGAAIALPEWEGFWFLLKGQIIVFTKDNEFLDTPMLDVYGKRDDWNVLTPNKELAVKLITGLRISIDAINTDISTVLKLNREVSLVRTELQLAFMYLGYLLAEIGTPSPYPQSMNVASPVIEKHADKATGVSPIIEKFRALDGTAQVKFLRVQVSLYVSTINWLFLNVFSADVPLKSLNEFPTIAAGREAIIHLINSRLWLGQQLNNIKESQVPSSDHL